MNTVFVSWKESLSLFLPKNAKLFFLVFLKTLLSTYKNAFIYGWWAFALSLCAVSLVIYVPLLTVSYINPVILSFLWAYMVFLSARPSTQLKSWRYYSSYLVHGLWIFLVIIVLSWLWNFLFTAAFHAASLSVWISYPLALSLYGLVFTFFFSLDFYLWIISPWTIFFSLFVFDSLRSFPRFMLSMWRSLKMVLSNYPFCFILYAVIRVGLWGLGVLLKMIGMPLVVTNGIMLLLLPIPIVLFTCFYTKRLHDQFGFYFSTTPRS